MEIINRIMGYRDINSTYISLDLLGHMAKELKTSNFEHLEIVLDCLKERDDSIKTLALKVLTILANEGNVETIVKELIKYLVDEEDDEIKKEATEKTCQIIERHSPSRRWQVDQFIKVLTLAGKHINDESICCYLQLIAATSDLQSYSIVKMFGSLEQNMIQDALAKVTLWCIGEFGELLASGEIMIKIQNVFDTINSLLNSK